MLWLAAISAVVVLLSALFLTLDWAESDLEPEAAESELVTSEAQATETTDETDVEVVEDSSPIEGYWEDVWTTLGGVMSPEITESEHGWKHGMLMLVVALIGLLIVSTIIGVLTSGLENKLDILRRGRSIVIERKHTVILGWSTKIAAAVQELAIANEDNRLRRDRKIVILADKDKVEMEEYIDAHVKDKKGSEIICRRGDPCDLDDLDIVRWHTARSIILFAEHGEGNDALVLKRAMALMRRSEETDGATPPIIAEVIEQDNYEAIANMGGNIQIVQPPQLVTRILLQAARDPGLSRVYEELINFEGSEFYPYPQKDSKPREVKSYVDRIGGMTFKDACMSFKKCSVVGILTPDENHIINPPGTTRLGIDDRLLLIAEDDAEIGNMEPQPMSFDTGNCVEHPSRQSSPENYTVIGWHMCADILLKELDKQLAPGSTLEVIYDDKYTDGPDSELLDALKNVKVTTRCFNTCSRSELLGLDLSSIDEFILLSYRDTLKSQEADSRTLLTLLHVRELVKESSRTIGIITELLVAQNRILARRGHQREDDFIASEELVGNLMVQLSEFPELKGVFDSILKTEGAELHLRAASDYVKLDERIHFGAIVEEGFARSEIVVGILDRTPGESTPDLRMAVHKDEYVTLGAEDSIVVFAED